MLIRFLNWITNPIARWELRLAKRRDDREAERRLAAGVQVLPGGEQ